MSAQHFLESLYGKIADIFQEEAERRAIWSDPEPRAGLLEGLAENDFDCEQMAEMQTIIAAETSDLFDLLPYVAFAADRDDRAKLEIVASVMVRERFYANSARARFRFGLRRELRTRDRRCRLFEINPLIARGRVVLVCRLFACSDNRPRIFTIRQRKNEDLTARGNTDD